MGDLSVAMDVFDSVMQESTERTVVRVHGQENSNSRIENVIPPSRACLLIIEEMFCLWSDIDRWTEFRPYRLNSF